MWWALRKDNVSTAAAFAIIWLPLATSFLANAHDHISSGPRAKSDGLHTRMERAPSLGCLDPSICALAWVTPHGSLKPLSVTAQGGAGGVVGSHRPHGPVDSHAGIPFSLSWDHQEGSWKCAR